MTVTVVNLVPRKQVEDTQFTQYTAVNCKTIIDKFTVTNTSLGNVTLSTNLVASQDVPSDSNLVLKTRTIGPGQTYTCPELVGQVLESGGFISTLASAPTALTISVSGREIT